MEDAEHLAFDFGASNARAIAGKLENSKLKIKEIYRFTTGGVKVLDSIYWDILGFYSEIKKALSVQSKKGKLRTCGIDTWGVDFVLLDKNGRLISNPYHYRDKRTNNIMDIAFKVVPPKKIFKITGIQFMQINSLFQLYSSKIYENHFLNIADKFLMIADFFNYLLTGKKFSEYTIATTSQLLDLKTKDWSYKLIEEFGFPKKIFPKIIEPGSIIGKILGSISTETGINKNLKIIAPATHDTASAIVSVPVPFDEKDFLYISSGTWALFGTELNEPNTSENALKYNFTNEGGVFGTIRFLKNITCFWLIQECRRIWEEKSGKKMTFSKLTEEALDPSIKPFSFFIYPDSPDFLNPIDMPQAIKDFCKKTGQKIPHKKGEMVRCILESIAFRYREIYKNIKEIFPMKTFKTIYIVGGGAQNSALSQFTANATGITVKAGPIEATAIGNLLIQAYNEYNIKSLKEIRKIVRNSQNIITFRPEERSFWDEGFKKYKNYVKNY